MTRLKSIYLGLPRYKVPMRRQFYGGFPVANKGSYKSRHFEKCIGENTRNTVTGKWGNLSYQSQMSAASLSISGE